MGGGAAVRRLVAIVLTGLTCGIALAGAAQAQRNEDDAAALTAEARRLHQAGRYAEAEPLYKRTLAIREKALGPDHPDVSTSLNNLAQLYYAPGRHAEAEPLYKRSLAICEKALGPDQRESGDS